MQRVILSVEPVRYPLTGIGRYALELSRQLPKVYPKEYLQFFDGYRLSGSFTYEETKTVSKFNSQLSSLKSLAKKSSLISDIYFRVKQAREAKILRGLESSVVHATNFACPRFAGKKIVTVHDMSAYLMPECQEKVRLDILKRECEYTARNAEALITISKSSKEAIVNYFGYPADRVFVTPLACNDDFYVCNEGLSRQQLKPLGLIFKQYTLFVGTVEPRKNLTTLIYAYRKLPKVVRERIPLVICGHSGWKSDKIFQEIRKATSEGWLYYLNYVDQVTLLSLYAGASLFCFPSLYEGFGLPILEAMASKVPVISANNSSLPEVVGDAGVLVAAEDVDSWTESIRAVLESTTLANKLIYQGVVRSKQFSWERCALATLEAYKAVEEL